jgi:hypothetical protein
MYVRQQLLAEEERLTKTSQEVERKQGKIDALESTIARQDVGIKEDMAILASWRQKLYDMELARDICTYLQKEVPMLPVMKDSFNSIYLTIFYAQKYEKIYQQKYPSLSQFLSWKTCIQVIWIESRFNLFAHGHYSELGETQVPEYNNFRLKDGSVNPKKTMNLYPMLCKLGYKKYSYAATIDYFVNNPEPQINCFYDEFVGKLKDTGGNFIAAVVAYNGAKVDPENSGYWLSYLKAQHRFNVWYDDVETKLK